MSKKARTRKRRAPRRPDWKRWIRSGADERAVAQGCTFDIDAAERVRSFFRRFLVHSKGTWAGQPFELAPAYVYLASDDSSYTTGEVIHINGGQVVTT